MCNSYIRDSKKLPDGDVAEAFVCFGKGVMFGKGALGTTYDPSLFNADGVSHFHVADVAMLPGVMAIVALDTPLLMFGNNSASWSSGDWGDSPDYDTGAWYNIFNQWNSNWVSAWPWNEEVATARYNVTFF